jgi:hypothetical protein
LGTSSSLYICLTLARKMSTSTDLCRRRSTQNVASTHISVYKNIRPIRKVVEKNIEKTYVDIFSVRKVSSTFF